MFELQIALKYLIPKRKLISTALISLMSVVVVSLVVWLVLVFLSVTAGIEKTWLNKLTSLYAPLRISPSESYYQSYFYQIDSHASASSYTLKTIGEKAEALKSDPYAASIDMEIPEFWLKADLDGSKNLVDPVKIALRELESLKSDFPNLRFQDYEISGALLKIDLERQGRISHLTQMSYLFSFMDKNPHLASLLLPPSNSDLEHGADFLATIQNGSICLPEGAQNAVLIPKSYRDSGVLIGDKGVLIYSVPSAALAQEQRISIRVAGFYDPGLLSLGNRCLIVPSHMTRQMYASSQTYSPDGTPTNGLFIWPDRFDDVSALQQEIAFRFEQAGIGKYWNITSYDQYEFSKDLLQQFRSDRTLFSLIGAIILFVACCNIISLLVLLVNDKKREIAILQSMGASSKSIAIIFAICGTAMGFLSCIIGSLLAIFTLHNLDSLISFLSAVQGRAAFNPLFFGQNLPNELSYEALLFVLIATPLLSFIAALIPSLKACKIRATAVLRAE